MLDFSNEIFDTVAKDLRSLYKGITVVGEYVESPAKFPTVTVDEISNIPEHLDSAMTNKYAKVIYRSQIFCNGNGKRKKAREILDSLDKKLMEIGFTMKTYTTTPTIYNSDVYCITTTHEGVVGADGMIYRA
jgi:hypothetical protein